MAKTYKCDKCGVTSTNPADALLNYFCANCVRISMNRKK